MKNLAAKEAKNRFGSLLDSAQREPVVIEKKGRPVAVLLSMEEYRRLEALEDQALARLADEAMQEGFLSEEASEKLLTSLLHA